MESVFHSFVPVDYYYSTTFSRSQLMLHLRLFQNKKAALSNPNYTLLLVMKVEQDMVVQTKLLVLRKKIKG